MEDSESDFLLDLICGVCEKQATKRNPALRARLRAYKVAEANLNNHIFYNVRKNRGYVWCNGEKIKETGNGRYPKNT